MSSAALPVALLVAPGFAETQFTDAQKALLGGGGKVRVVTTEGSLVQGWHEEAWGHHFMADAVLADVLASDYAGLIVPGGVRSIDALLESPHARRVVKAFVDTGKPVLMIGEALALLVRAEVAATRRVAAPAGLADVVAQAGGTVEGEVLTRDDNLLTVGGNDGAREAIGAFIDTLRGEDTATREAA
ncbi:MAG: peptidase C56 [Alphaproteobacteria bacterium]|nr:peptidase C56 [Alphaproteobacteria bacterium]